jgi:cyclic beta-1,2-glucan synthetase
VELSRSPEDVTRYRGEPYVVAADVSSAQGKIGRSGWTWYTGSAGWMYRIWIEEVLGFQLRGDKLRLKPAIPEDWPGFEMTYHYGSAIYEIAVLRHDASIPMAMELDGRPVNDSFVPLADDGITHHLTVRIARRSAAAIIDEPIRHSSNGHPVAAPSNGALPPSLSPRQIQVASGD